MKDLDAGMKSPVYFCTETKETLKLIDVSNTEFNFQSTAAVDKFSQPYKPSQRYSWAMTSIIVGSKFGLYTRSLSNPMLHKNGIYSRTYSCSKVDRRDCREWIRVFIPRHNNKPEFYGPKTVNSAICFKITYE